MYDSNLTANIKLVLNHKAHVGYTPNSSSSVLLFCEDITGRDTSYQVSCLHLALGQANKKTQIWSLFLSVQYQFHLKDKKKKNIQKYRHFAQISIKWNVKKKRSIIIWLASLREKCPYSEFFWPVFSNISDWIRRDTPYLPLFSPSAGKYGPKNFRIRTLFTQCILLLWLQISLNITHHKR